MKIISFTGKSGTGKSYQSIKICRQRNIDAVIDDGLFIYKNRIAAGTSAKKCKSKAAAMRTTLFNYEKQKKEVKRKIKEIKPEKILILGTSDKMVDWIIAALDLPVVSERIYITDVTTEQERKTAHESRYDRGEHIIPVPMVQLKHDFAGYILNPARLLKNISMEDSGSSYERTVVRPAYSYYGKFVIRERVIEDIIHITAEKYSDKVKVMDFFHNSNTGNLLIIIEVEILKNSDSVKKCGRLQKNVKYMIEQMTAFSVKSVNIVIKDMYVK